MNQGITVALLCIIVGTQLDGKVPSCIWYFIGTIYFLGQFIF